MKKQNDELMNNIINMMFKTHDTHMNNTLMLLHAYVLYISYKCETNKCYLINVYQMYMNQ